MQVGRCAACTGRRWRCGKGEVPADLARLLLKENVRMVLGAWQVNQGPEEYLVVFSAPVSATADAATLQEVI